MRRAVLVAIGASAGLGVLGLVLARQAQAAIALDAGADVAAVDMPSEDAPAVVLDTVNELWNKGETMITGRWTLPSAGEPYRALIEAAEADNGIPSMLLARLLYQESRFRPDIISGRTVSSVGAMGIAQFMPATARDLGIDPLDPKQAIPGAGRYLAQLYRAAGDWAGALAAYNWGIGNVTRKGIGQAPAETRAYVAQILGDTGYA